MIHFGTVDQHHDYHHIIRGLTASTEHIDEDYAVGTYQDYDCSLAYRTDAFEDNTGKLLTHSWMILEIKLKRSSVDIPHIFMGAHDHSNSPYSKLFMTHSSIQKVPLGTFEQYDPEFMNRYGLFTRPAYFIEVERYFNAAVTKVISAHFWPQSIEVHQGSVFVYADNQQVTIRLLETMMKNGVWLAEELDRRVFSDI
jgi:hypothetical protein